MKNKSLRIKLSIFINISLLICMSILLYLVYYSTYIEIGPISIPVDGVTIEIVDINGILSSYKVMIVLFMFAIVIIDTFITYFILGKFLKPLEELSFHMSESTFPNKIDIKSNDKEISILIESFNHMIDELNTSFEMQKMFSSHIAHELRTPLAVMKTNIAVYKKKNENYDSIIDKMDIQISKLTELIEKIFDLSEVKKVKLDEKIHICSLFEDILYDLSLLSKEKNITINKLYEDHELYVKGSYMLLYRAYYNLIENAIIYNNDNGKIDIYMEILENKLQILISDTGIGIDEEFRDFIFEPFYQINKKSERGLGVGLSFSKAIFEHHGGYIKLLFSEIGTKIKTVLTLEENEIINC